MMKVYCDYEDLEEAFRYMIAQSIKLPYQSPKIPIVERHRNNAAPNDEYGVVTLLVSEVYGSPSTERKKLTGDIVELNVCDTQSILFSVEFCGVQARNLAARSKLWMDSEEGTSLMNETGFAVQDVSGLRALHELIRGGKSWERRAQFDVGVLAVIEQEPAARKCVGLVQTICVTNATHDNEEIVVTYNELQTVYFSTVVEQIDLSV